MKNYFCVFFTSFLIFSCNQGIDYKSIIQEYESEELLCISLLEVEGKKILSGNNFTGSCLIYNNDYTRKVMLISYISGVEEGINIGYYPDGKVDYIGYKNNGEINGDYVKFHNNGEIAIEGQFKDGVYVGSFKYFDKSGELIEKTRYNEFGILTNTKKY